MKKLLPILIMAVIAVGGGAFYAGIKYAESQGPVGQFSRQDFQNLSPEDRQRRIQESDAQLRQDFDGQANAGAGFRGGAYGGQRGGGGFTAGEIIFKDDKSVTVKLKDGGSKIVFLSDTVEIIESVKGTLSDLEIGKNITASGAINSDGSVTAQTIQLRP